MSLPPRAVELIAQLGLTPEQLAARGLIVYPEATALALVHTGDDGREYHLTPPAAAAWLDMHAAAARDGITLRLISAYRSVARQIEIIERKLANGVAPAEINSVLAPPGYSEHHTGNAVDIDTPGSPLLEIGFENTPAYAWLTAHAADFSFYLSYPRNNPSGYQYEPWHWCYRAAGPMVA